MSNKSMLPALSPLFLATGIFALDEYMPIPYRVMQINIGMERSSINGDYQGTWESDEISDPDNPTALPVQGKFGLLDGLEGSMAINYLVQDRDGHTGLDRPVLALKYGDPVSGGGGFLAVSLPVGFEDIMNAGNYATMSFGAMYCKNFPRINLLSNASYSFNTEDNNQNKIDNLRLFAKPEYPLALAFVQERKQYLGVSLAAVYNFYFNRMEDGTSVDVGAHLFQLIPGVYYTFSKVVSAEISAAFALAGQNQPDAQTVRLQLFFSLEETLYNAL
jgi:hypothetical protein